MLFNNKKKKSRSQLTDLQERCRGVSKEGAAPLWYDIHPGAMDMSCLLPDASGSHKGHRGLFVPALGCSLTEHTVYFVLSGSISSSCLSKKKEESHSTGPEPLLKSTTGSNRATQVLILFDGTKSRVKEHSVSQAQFNAISAQSACGSCPLSCGHLLTRNWDGSHRLVPETRGKAGR